MILNKERDAYRNSGRGPGNLCPLHRCVQGQPHDMKFLWFSGHNTLIIRISMHPHSFSACLQGKTKKCRCNMFSICHVMYFSQMTSCVLFLSVTKHARYHKYQGTELEFKSRIKSSGKFSSLFAVQSAICFLLLLSPSFNDHTINILYILRFGFSHNNFLSWVLLSNLQRRKLRFKEIRQ